MRKRVERMGRWVDADQVFETWTSADLGRMLGARSFQTNPIDRHFLLQGIVRATYRLQSDPEMRRVSVETGMMHLSELSTVVRALRIEFCAAFPRVPSFAWLATALAEEGRVDDAIQVCETAARFGLEDGTKAGGSSDAWRRRSGSRSCGFVRVAGVRSAGRHASRGRSQEVRFLQRRAGSSCRGFMLCRPAQKAAYGTCGLALRCS